MTDELIELLRTGDLRSASKSNQLADQVTMQQDFDDLFDLMFHKERTLAMHAADVVEKISASKPQFLRKHKNAIEGLLLHADHIEIKWHVALMISRVKLSKTALTSVWAKLREWALDKQESRIVRVNAIQAMNDLLPQCNSLAVPELLQVMEKVSLENIPSVKARLKRLYTALKEKVS